MKTKYDNLAIIWQPKFTTDEFIVDRKKQKGKNYNYILVCCAPSYNGLWKYKVDPNKNYGTFINKSVICTCIPVEDCEKVHDLEYFKGTELEGAIRSEQNRWFKQTKKVRRQDWMF